MKLDDSPSASPPCCVFTGVACNHLQDLTKRSIGLPRPTAATSPLDYHGLQLLHPQWSIGLPRPTAATSPMVHWITTAYSCYTPNGPLDYHGLQLLHPQWFIGLPRPTAATSPMDYHGLQLLHPQWSIGLPRPTAATSPMVHWITTA